jgi:6-phosphogluconolactonase/glucosamine-6-phosphate isomerase/deaminase
VKKINLCRKDDPSSRHSPATLPLMELSSMDLIMHADSLALGTAAGNESGDLIAASIQDKGQEFIVIAAGVSQFAALAALVARTDTDRSVVTCFHLDEYIGLPDSASASLLLESTRTLTAVATK